MSELSADTLKACYFGLAALVVALLSWNGWRQGVFRQAGSIVAIVGAYSAAWFGASSIGPVFAFLHCPPQLLNLIGGLAIGLITLVGVRSLSSIIFQRTSQQEAGTARMSYGVFGALLGFVFSLFLFVLASDAIRLLGGLAQTNVDLARQSVLPPVKGHAPAPVEQPNIVIRSLAKLGGALNSDGSGKFFQHYDPVPTNVYSSIIKLGLMVSNPEAIDRFVSFPGVEQLAHHPKIIALRDDPSIGQLLASKSYLKLLRHERVVALASDPEFSEEIKALKFEEALDFALKGLPTPGPEPKP